MIVASKKKAMVHHSILYGMFNAESAGGRDQRK